MIILQLNTKDVTMVCICGQRHTFTFDRGAVNSKPGPFAFKENDVVTYRFNDDGYNLGNGIQEVVVIKATDFPDINNISADQMVQKLNSVLVNGEAINDYGTVLVQSKISGPTSCAEVLDGSGAQAMGYNVRGDAFEHFCCGRMVLGYVPPFLPVKEHTEVIMLRRCNACKGQSTIIRNMVDHSNDEGWGASLVPRKANNTLAIYLKGNGWIDPDLVDFYKNETSGPPEYFKEFFGQTSSLDIAKYEDVSAALQKNKQ